VTEEKKHPSSLKAHIEQTSELLRKEAKTAEHSTTPPSIAHSFVSQIRKVSRFLKDSLPRKKRKK
jgi:hypothetical protein